MYGPHLLVEASGSSWSGFDDLEGPLLMVPPLSSSRSFSELYTLSLKEPSRRGAPEPVQDGAVKVVLLPPTKQLLHFSLQDNSGPPGPGDLTEERTEFLHSHNSLSTHRYTLWASPLWLTF